MQALSPEDMAAAIARMAAVDLAHPALDMPRAERALAALDALVWRSGVPIQTLSPLDTGLVTALGGKNQLLSVQIAEFCIANGVLGSDTDAALTTILRTQLRALDFATNAAGFRALIARLSQFRSYSQDTDPKLASFGLIFAAPVIDGVLILSLLVDAYEAGAWLVSFHDGRVILLPQPEIHIEAGLLHRADGPAIGWTGFRQGWFWRGVPVPAHVIKDPATITSFEIFRQGNSEIQRVMIERYGWERFMGVTQSSVIDHDDRWGTLRVMRTPVQPLLVLEVTNRSPEPDGRYRRYVLPVHPDLCPIPDTEAGETQFGRPQALTALNAVASTFGMTGRDYAALHAES